MLCWKRILLFTLLLHVKNCTFDLLDQGQMSEGYTFRVGFWAWTKLGARLIVTLIWRIWLKSHPIRLIKANKSVINDSTNVSNDCCQFVAFVILKFIVDAFRYSVLYLLNCSISSIFFKKVAIGISIFMVLGETGFLVHSWLQFVHLDISL